jgi:secreted trypsin-like serine protease
MKKQCAGFAAGVKDSCQRDSGGPLIVPDGRGGWLQAGVVSLGFGCARPDWYGVYTRLSPFEAWVAQQIGVGKETMYQPLVMSSPRRDGAGDHHER